MAGASTRQSFSARLKIAQTVDPHGEVVELSGELDLATVPELDRRLLELSHSSPGRVLLDLGGVEFMDSAGLAAIMRAHQAAESHGHDLVLRRGTNQVQRLFQLTELIDRVTFDD